MLSLEYIEQEELKAAKRAARENKLPFVYWDATEVEKRIPFPFPILGSYIPKGWQRIDELFCDSSGFGDENEPALTSEELIRDIKEYIRWYAGRSVGFALTRCGEFQVYVGVYLQD
jgi:hypothetical protein